MSGKKSRTKGHSFERTIAKELRDATGVGSIRRGLQYRDGSDAPDVVCPPFHIECKRQARVSIEAALEQAVEACADDLTPVAVTKKDRGKVIVSMYLSDWIALVREEIALEEEWRRR